MQLIEWSAIHLIGNSFNELLCAYRKRTSFGYCVTADPKTNLSVHTTNLLPPEGWINDMLVECSICESTGAIL
jgi:hypothetical protein